MSFVRRLEQRAFGKRNIARFYITTCCDFCGSTLRSDNLTKWRVPGDLRRFTRVAFPLLANCVGQAASCVTQGLLVFPLFGPFRPYVALGMDDLLGNVIGMSLENLRRPEN